MHKNNLCCYRIIPFEIKLSFFHHKGLFTIEQVYFRAYEYTSALASFLCLTENKFRVGKWVINLDMSFLSICCDSWWPNPEKQNKRKYEIMVDWIKAKFSILHMILFVTITNKKFILETRELTVYFCITLPCCDYASHVLIIYK